MGYAFNQCKTPKGNDIEKTMDPKLWVMEPKIDGWRIRMEIDSITWEVKSFTRTDHDATGKLTRSEFEFKNAVIRYNLGTTVLDGEAVWVNHRGEPDFSITASIMGSGLDISLAKQMQVDKIGRLKYIVFDVFMFDGRDMRGYSYDTRRAALMSLLAHNDMFINTQLIDVAEPSLLQHEENIAKWQEGSILKYRGAVYEGKRTKYWLKWKHAPDEDVVIMGFKAGEGKYTGLIGAIQFGQQKQGPDDGCWQLTERGFCSGMTDSERHWITGHQDELFGKVMTIKTFGVLAQGGFRHPQFLRFRGDKDPMECDWT